MKIKLYENGHVLAVIKRTQEQLDKFDTGDLLQDTLQRKLKQYEDIGTFSEEYTTYNPKTPQEVLKQSLNRTKQTIYDYANNNTWTYFTTVTVNPSLFPNYSHEEVSHVFRRKVLAILKKQNKDFKYIFIMELQKNGRLHWHGLTSNIPFESFRYFNENLGRTQHSKVKNTQRVSNYITKYVTKDFITLLPNKSRYIVSRNCTLPISIDTSLSTLDEFEQLLIQADYHKKVNSEFGEYNYLHFNTTEQFMTIFNNLSVDNI